MSLLLSRTSPLVRRDDSSEHVEERTLAGAIWADQSQAGAMVERKRYVVGDDDRAIALAQSLDF
jgi:hypothetical protein